MIAAVEMSFSSKPFDSRTGRADAETGDTTRAIIAMNRIESIEEDLQVRMAVAGASMIDLGRRNLSLRDET